MDDYMHPFYLNLLLENIRKEGKCKVEIEGEYPITGIGRSYDNTSLIILFEKEFDPRPISVMKHGTYWNAGEVVVPDGGKFLLGRNIINASKSKNSLSAYWSRFWG